MSTQIDLGPVLSIPKGDWNADTTYERLNMVRHNSAAWICNVATSKGVEPTEDSTDWYLQVKDTSSVTSVNGMKGDVVIELTETETPPANDNSNRIATTAWVTDKLGDVDLSGIKDDTVLAAQLASNLEVSKDTLSYAELMDYIARVERNVKLPLGFEYTRLTGESAPLGGVDYMGQTATRAMYIDLWMWLNENKPDAIISESEWQSLYSSQNGNVAKYSSGDGSTTFRFPRVVGYLKGADAVSNLGEYMKEGLPGHTHTRGTMNITGEVTSDDINFYWGAGTSASGAFSNAYVGGSRISDGEWNGKRGNGFYFDASRSWTGETSQPTNPIYSNSDHVTPETVTIVMGVIAFSSVASIGEATEEGIVAELGEHGAKLGELEAAIEAFHDNCVGEIFSWPADSEPYRALPINGAAVSRTTYAKLFAKIGTKYGAGDGSTTFNVPNGIGKFLQCDNTAGTVKAAGLPNILGNFRSTGMGGSYLTDGAFYAEGTIVGQNHAGGSADRPPIIYFNASRFNSIYGNSDTVQPPALTMRYYIKY